MGEGGVRVTKMFLRQEGGHVGATSSQDKRGRPENRSGCGDEGVQAGVNFVEYGIYAP